MNEQSHSKHGRADFLHYICSYTISVLFNMFPVKYSSYLANVFLGLSCTTNLWYIRLNTFRLMAMDFASQVMQNDYKESYKKKFAYNPFGQYGQNMTMTFSSVLIFHMLLW